MPGAEGLEEVWDHGLVEHRLEFDRGAGEGKDDALLMLEADAGSGAAGVVQMHAALRQVSLAEVAVGGRTTARGKECTQCGNCFGGAKQRARGRLGYGLAGNIILGGPQPPGDDDDVGSLKCVPQNFCQAA